MLAHEPAEPAGPDHATRSLARFEHVRVDAGRDQRMRGGEPADPATDDRDLEGHACAESSRTAVTIARTCSGSVCCNTAP